MLEHLARWRTVVNFRKAPFEVYSLQGKPQKDLLWYNISYDEKTGSGFFLVHFEPGAISIPHEHLAFEEFVVLEGEFIEHDGTVYRPGDCVSLSPGSQHCTKSETGATAAVFVRGGFRTLRSDEMKGAPATKRKGRQVARAKPGAQVKPGQKPFVQTRRTTRSNRATKRRES